jgi:hypothetical protein
MSIFNLKNGEYSTLSNIEKGYNSMIKVSV